MKNITITTIAIAMATGLMFSTSALAQTASSAEYKASLERINAEYAADKNNCASLSGNANDICMAQAKGKEKVAKADLDAARKNTKKARYDARIAKADAEYAVAKEKCDDLAGNNKDVCLKEAKSAEVSAQADAKAQMKITDAQQKANKETAETRQDVSDTSMHAVREADADKRDAEYAVAKEKCDALAGNAKNNCIHEAKTHYNKM